jgi:hypothetical protein
LLFCWFLSSSRFFFCLNKCWEFPFQCWWEFLQMLFDIIDFSSTAFRCNFLIEFLEGNWIFWFQKFQHLTRRKIDFESSGKSKIKWKWKFEWNHKMEIPKSWNRKIFSCKFRKQSWYRKIYIQICSLGFSRNVVMEALKIVSTNLGFIADDAKTKIKKFS